jgi:AcrR family transcriptional regulator
MQLFWSEGFESTSIPQLEKHLGINRFSIYDTFGSKQNLFLEALDAYSAMLIEKLVVPLEAGSNGLKDLEEFLTRFKKLFIDSSPTRGCFLCNSATELGHRDEQVARRVDGYFKRIEKAVLSCLSRAVERGELSVEGATLEERARVARCCLEGLLIDLRLRKTRRENLRSLDALKSCILR